MLKTKVLISDISNLTDVRYFAAWGVDYIGFDLNNKSLSTTDIIEMINWVEGPSFFLRVGNEEHIDQVFEIKTKSKLDGILTLPGKQQIYNKQFPDLKQFEDHGNYYLQNDNVSQFKYDIVHFLDELKNLDLNNLDGIILGGGEEEKTGYKDFDKLDAIFEYLEVGH